jgi:hypothetical protein
MISFAKQHWAGFCFTASNHLLKPATSQGIKNHMSSLNPANSLKSSSSVARFPGKFASKFPGKDADKQPRFQEEDAFTPQNPSPPPFPSASGSSSSFNQTAMSPPSQDGDLFKDDNLLDDLWSSFDTKTVNEAHFYQLNEAFLKDMGPESELSVMELPDEFKSLPESFDISAPAAQPSAATVNSFVLNSKPQAPITGSSSSARKPSAAKQGISTNAKKKQTRETLGFQSPAEYSAFLNEEAEKLGKPIQRVGKLTCRFLKIAKAQGIPAGEESKQFIRAKLAASKSSQLAAAPHSSSSVSDTLPVEPSSQSTAMVSTSHPA